MVIILNKEEEEELEKIWKGNYKCVNMLCYSNKSHRKQDDLLQKLKDYGFIVYQRSWPGLFRWPLLELEWEQYLRNIKVKSDRIFSTVSYNITNSWNLAVGNVINQNFESNNDKIDEIIEKIYNDNHEFKEDIKKLLEEYKKSHDPSKLVDIYNVLWTATTLWTALLSWISNSI